MRKYTDEDEEGGFNEEFIDDDYGDPKPAAKPIKKDFWEPPTSKPSNTTSKTLVMAGASAINKAPLATSKPS
jgi:hypothetical protein